MFRRYRFDPDQIGDIKRLDSPLCRSPTRQTRRAGVTEPTLALCLVDLCRRIESLPGHVVNLFSTSRDISLDLARFLPGQTCGPGAVHPGHLNHCCVQTLLFLRGPLFKRHIFAGVFAIRKGQPILDQRKRCIAPRYITTSNHAAIPVSIYRFTEGRSPIEPLSCNLRYPRATAPFDTLRVPTCLIQFGGVNSKQTNPDPTDIPRIRVHDPHSPGWPVSGQNHLWQHQNKQQTKS